MIISLLVPVLMSLPSLKLEEQVRSEMDRMFEKHWRATKCRPTGKTDDATFLRRVYLDLTGAVPTVELTQRFLEDRRQHKRDRLVTELLASNEFNDYWGGLLTEMVTGRRPIRYESHDGHLLQAYFRNALKVDSPYTNVVTELLTAEGSSDRSNPPVAFLFRYEVNPIDLTGAVGSRFLGVSIQCAQCHKHPFLPITREDFWGLAGHFGKTRRLDDDNGNDDEYLMSIVEALRGELRVGGKVIRPRLPGIPTDAEEPSHRRVKLARWVTAHPYFARNAVNRVWHQLFGHGFVADVDGVIDTTPSAFRDILLFLADDFRLTGTKIKRLIRVLVLSDVYQLGSMPANGNTADAVKVFASFPVRPLTADQLYRSIGRATGYADPAVLRADEEARAKGGLKRENADPPVELFGPRPFALQRTLAVLHAEHVEFAVRAGARAALKESGRRKQVLWLFLATLSRPPRPEEERIALRLAGDSVEGLEDVLWALINSAEFLSAH